jgi:hypothetical protein
MSGSPCKILIDMHSKIQGDLWACQKHRLFAKPFAMNEFYQSVAAAFPILKYHCKVFKALSRKGRIVRK